jgi:hypothetical protein
LHLPTGQGSAAGWEYRFDRSVRPSAYRFTLHPATVRPRGVTPLRLPLLHRGFADNFLTISPTYGLFLDATARACQATRIVEFGPSMGISTIYLSAALQNNGGGHLISSELKPV